MIDITYDMYRDNYFIDACRLPEDSVHIWRYMDFAKLMSIIDAQELFFTTSDKFEDSFEGSFPQKCAAENYCLDKNTAKELAKVTINFRKYAHLNCWHQNECESEAMWKIYSQSDRGIAIQSTIGRLKHCFTDEREVNIGKVKYIDYNVDAIPVGDFFSPFFYKRKSFSYEQEIRALVQTLDDVPIEKREKNYPEGIYPYGIGIKIDINLLIENIYISPYAPNWFYDLIKSITLKYGYNFNIKKSILSAKPMF